MSAQFNIRRASSRMVSVLQRELDLPRFVAATLVGRGIDTPKAARAFLFPSFKHDWLDPYLIPGLGDVVDALEDAVRKGSRILVFGDFDLDGISATTVLTRGLRELGADAVPFIPKRFEEGYGITECAPLLAANPINRNKVGSVGPAVQNVTVKIDREKPTDETGEILAKGPNVMLGYCDMPEETAAVFTEDGFFRTGDIGYTDKDGYIYITGRKKNVIILSNGKNVFPEELEEHLSSVPLFLESAVVGRTDSKGETVITAVIYPDYNALKDKTEEEIEAILRNQLNEINRTLPQYKQMRGLEIRKTEFEKTTSRKIKRYKI